MPLIKKILVPVDGSSTSDKALDQALALAQDSQAARALAQQQAAQQLIEQDPLVQSLMRDYGARPS